MNRQELIESIKLRLPVPMIVFMIILLTLFGGVRL